MCLIGAPLSLSLVLLSFPWFFCTLIWHKVRITAKALSCFSDSYWSRIRSICHSSLAWWGQVQCVEERTLSGPEAHMRTSEDAPGLMDVISISRDTLKILYLDIMVVVLWTSGFCCTCVHPRKMHQSSLPLPLLLFPRNVFNLKLFLTRSESLRTQVYRS